MDPWLILVIIIVISLIAAGIVTGRLKRVRVGADGVEIEGHDRPESPSVVVPAPAIEATQPSARDEVQSASRWREYVVAEHDLYFGKAEQKIDALSEIVSRGPTGNITSIRGVGGIGKTAAAYEVVSQSQGHYSMVAWSSFRQHQNPTDLERGQGTGRSSRQVLRDLSSQLGLSINTSDAVVADRFADALRKISTAESVLFVVDNLERLVDVNEIARYFLNNGLLHHCHLVLTTRASAARVSPTVNEWIVEDLPLEPSCDLIRHEGRASSAVYAADNAALRPIHSVVDGNPYLMKLIARRLCYETRPLDQLLRDIRRLDQAGSSSLPTSKIQDYMFTSSLKQLADIAGEANTVALVHAFGSEPPGSRIAHENLQQLSNLGDNEFQRTLDTAYDLSLVNKHGLNELFSIHSLLHQFTSGGKSGLTGGGALDE